VPVLSEKAKSQYEQEEFEETQSTMIDTVKSNANELILDRFPRYDQRNLANGTKTEITDRQTGEKVTQSEMNTLINDMISATESFETDINNANTLDELESIDVSESNLESKAGW